MDELKILEKKAKLVRKWSLISTTEGGSGHPTSCLSAADLGTVLFDKYFTYDTNNPLNLYNDRFVLSKGHAAPLLYTLFGIAGAYPLEELKTLRKFGSRFEGHPTPKYVYAEAATGSLGQGLSVGAGLALLAKREKLPYKTFVLLGDGELAEGQIWEAANFASHYKLDNLIAIADINRLAQSQETMFGHHIEEYISRFQGFGFETIAIDGNNIFEVDKAFKLATQNNSSKPYIILAKTFKGKGISFLENKEGWHGKPLKKEDLDKAITELGEVDDSMRFSLRKPEKTLLPKKPEKGRNNVEMTFEKGKEIATREIYGETLAKIGEKNKDVYALDADVKNSTFSQDFLKAIPQRFIECFIAEQNMVSVAVGLSRLGKNPFVSTFAAFLVRAADQIRMARVSGANIKFVGSHVGVAIGEDGPSQMGLEDIAMFGTIPDSVVLQPADAVTTSKLLPEMADHQGISYMRTLRPKTPIIYDNQEEFKLGGSKILRKSENDIVAIIASGITVFEALKAAEELQSSGISVRVIDCYSIKPIDQETLRKAVKETKKKTLITIEDHFEHGGLGDYVLSAVSDTGAKVIKMAVSHISQSGTKDELLDAAGINAAHLVSKIKKLIE